MSLVKWSEFLNSSQDSFPVVLKQNDVIFAFINPPTTWGESSSRFSWNGFCFTDETSRLWLPAEFSFSKSTESEFVVLNNSKEFLKTHNLPKWLSVDDIKSIMQSSKTVYPIIFQSKYQNNPAKNRRAIYYAFLEKPNDGSLVQPDLKFYKGEWVKNGSNLHQACIPQFFSILDHPLPVFYTKEELKAMKFPKLLFRDSYGEGWKPFLALEQVYERFDKPHVFGYRLGDKDWSLCECELDKTWFVKTDKTCNQEMPQMWNIKELYQLVRQNDHIFISAASTRNMHPGKFVTYRLEKILSPDGEFPMKVICQEFENSQWLPSDESILTWKPIDKSEFPDTPCNQLIWDKEFFDLLDNSDFPVYVEACGAEIDSININYYHYSDARQWRKFLISDKPDRSTFPITIKGYLWIEDSWTENEFKLFYIRKPMDPLFLIEHPLVKNVSESEFCDAILATAKLPFLIDALVTYQSRNEPAKWRKCLISFIPERSSVQFPCIFKDCYVFEEKFDQSNQRYVSWVRKPFIINQVRLCSDSKFLLENPLETFEFVNADIEYDDHYYRFSILQCLDLPLRNEVRELLVEKLDEIRNIKNYKHVDSVVKDIIDPDYLPILTQKSFFKQKYEVKEYYNNFDHDPLKILLKQEQDFDKDPVQLGPAQSTSSGILSATHESGYMEKSGPITTRTTFRDTFMWQPCLVRFTETKVEFITEIPKYFMEKHIQLYESLSEVLKLMIPAFKKIEALPKDLSKSGCIRQVIVKAQEYQIHPNSTYSGNWHREGKTENIKAVGVYYCKIEKLDGGNLQFVTPERNNRMNEEEFYCEAKVVENGAVVFDNQLFHRLLETNNLETTTQSRMFVNFFMVDPRMPIPLKTSYNTLFKILNRKFSAVIAENIMSNTDTLFPNDPLAFRMDVKRDMKRAVSAEAYNDYGNIGYIKMVDDKRNYRSRYVDFNR